MMGEIQEATKTVYAMQLPLFAIMCATSGEAAFEYLQSESRERETDRAGSVVWE